MRKNEIKITVPGFLFSSVSCGIKKNRKADLALIYAEEPAVTAAIFTTNRLKAAPVILGMERVSDGFCQALLINSGHANAMTGKNGELAAKSTTLALARSLKISPSLVIPSSTGLIGGGFPEEKITKAVPGLVSQLSSEGAEKAAAAIMTTDGFAKISSKKIKIGGKTATVCAIGKGAGMIAPDMATMLCFVLTDVKITRSFAEKTIRTAADRSFNRIIVDGDMSTNDSVFFLSGGTAGGRALSSSSGDGKKFVETVSQVCFDIARMIVEDGEGATKAVRVEVEGAGNSKEADKAAKAVGSSILVKCALFGEDPNFGRVAAAVGSSGIKFNPAKMDIFIGKLKVMSAGMEIAGVEKKAAKMMKQSEFTIKIRLSAGKGRGFVLMSDLSLDYVKLNSHYRI